MDKPVYRKPFNNYSRFKAGSDKDAKIAGFIQRKESSIKKYTDAKSMSIAISSAFNMSAERCNALVSVSKLDDKDYWEVHEGYYNEYLERFLAAQEDGAMTNAVNKAVETKPGETGSGGLLIPEEAKDRNSEL